jgi:hypothetical protein
VHCNRFYLITFFVEELQYNETVASHKPVVYRIILSLRKMYFYHDDVVTPPDDTVLWRYMDLEKFLTLLCERSLYLCRLDGFRDTWEGNWPEPKIPVGGPPIKTFGGLADALRQQFFVNCWHASEVENAGLWDIYSSCAGVAIRTTCGLLKAAVHDDSQFYMGEVTYHDYSDPKVLDHVGILSTAFLKRKNFEYEKEVRLLVWPDLELIDIDPKTGSAKYKLIPCMRLSVDLPTLIDRLYISPAAPKRVLSTIRVTLEKFSLGGIQIEHSNLYETRSS